MKVRSLAFIATSSIMLTFSAGAPAAAEPPARGEVSVVAGSNSCALGAQRYTPTTDSASQAWVDLLTYCVGIGGTGTLTNGSNVVWIVESPYPVTTGSTDGKKVQMHLFAEVDLAVPTRFVLPGETVAVRTAQFGGVRIDGDLTTRWHAFSIFVDALGTKRWADAWNCAAGAAAIVRTDPTTVWTSQELYDVALGAQATGETCLAAIERRTTDASKAARVPGGAAPKTKVVLNSPAKVRSWVLERPGAALADDALDIIWQVARAVR